MMPRTSATGATGRGRLAGNAHPTASTTAGRGFVEFHPSMSLENAPTLADCLSSPAEATASSNAKIPSLPALDANDATLESVLADRHHVWSKVNEVIEKMAPMEAYQGDVRALQKLHQLHLLCKQRETHLRALQLALLQEGRGIPSVEAATTSEATDNSENEDDKDVDAPNANQSEWQQEEERHFDFVDCDAMDLIELSEQCS